MTDDIQVGDKVRATSKHDPETVIVGAVTFVAHHALHIRPEGHRGIHAAERSDFTFEKVEPPIVFGPNAIIRYTQKAGNDAGEYRYRNGDGDRWHSYPGGGFRATTPTVTQRVRDGEAEVIFWGEGVEPR